MFFTEEEFAADEFFQQWVLIPDDENETFWKCYLEAYPNQNIAVSNARKLVEHLAETGFHIPNLTTEERKELKTSIFDKIEIFPGLEEVTEPIVKSINRAKRFWVAAASAAVILLTLVYFISNKNTDGASLVVSQKTVSKQVREILLPDSSIIILNGNSSVTYNKHFNDSAIREVFLEGNAYFKIKPTAEQKPFIVHANQVHIQVIGTEFNVNAHTQATDVVLTSGSINVTLAKDSLHKTHLIAGEKLMLDTIKQQLITEKADVDLYTAAWKDGEWHFEETTLETVASLIKQFYGIEVVFKNNESKKLMITAVVSVKDFSTLVHVIEKTLNISISETPTQLFIH